MSNRFEEKCEPFYRLTPYIIHARRESRAPGFLSGASRCDVSLTLRVTSMPNMYIRCRTTRRIYGHALFSSFLFFCRPVLEIFNPNVR